MGAKLHKQDPMNDRLPFLTLTAMGVVYGDIGTSPLYAMRECFTGPHGVILTPDNILGILSTILWSLLLIISFKYIYLVMRADNKGEGGVLALMALVHKARSKKSRVPIFVYFGLFGAALLYGDGMITPAISVLGAVEGLEKAAPTLHPYIIPITLVILVGLFSVQRFGTAKIGSLFGPIIVVWFLVLGILGILPILERTEVFSAINPLYALEFFFRNGWRGFTVLGAVFLVVTGGEALYADMGHFGKIPIRWGWYALVLPCLVIHYFGQGALLLSDPSAIAHPFYSLAPNWLLYPLIALATIATIIASQAVISGAYSLTWQGIQLGYLPRMKILHTSHEEKGQIYVPVVNWGLLLSTLWLVWTFGSSSKLAAAYGVAVATTMVITTVLFYQITQRLWGWSKAKSIALTVFLMIVDLAFFGANIIKIEEGGWFPLLIGGLVFTLMATWRKGREILAERLYAHSPSLLKFIKDDLPKLNPCRVPGTAVFMFGGTDGVPPALLHNLRHNEVLHEKVVILSVMVLDIPHVSIEERVSVAKLDETFFRIGVSYGFTDQPNIPAALAIAKSMGYDFSRPKTVYFLGRETLLTTEKPGMALWREKLFAVMSKNARRATSFYQIPPDQVIEIGLQIEL